MLFPFIVNDMIRDMLLADFVEKWSND